MRYWLILSELQASLDRLTNRFPIGIKSIDNETDRKINFLKSEIKRFTEKQNKAKVLVTLAD